jgi:hypothetical protein
MARRFVVANLARTLTGASKFRLYQGKFIGQKINGSDPGGGSRFRIYRSVAVQWAFPPGSPRPDPPAPGSTEGFTGTAAFATHPAFSGFQVQTRRSAFDHLQYGTPGFRLFRVQAGFTMC